MEKFKIEFSDVRLTPEQLKVIEDKIEELETKVDNDQLIKERFVKFLRKLTELLTVNESDINLLLSNNVDYDILIDSGVLDKHRMMIKFKKQL